MPGTTWKSETIFQEQISHPITNVDIQTKGNTTTVYGGAVAKGAPHPAAAKAWLAFIHSPTALKIFERYASRHATTRKRGRSGGSVGAVANHP